MALAIDATVHVDSRRATVHWHNEHDKAPEVARLADTHEVAQDVLCHELRALEVRYGKLEGLIQRLVGLVQRDCPALLLEFMGCDASQAHARHDPAAAKATKAAAQEAAESKAAAAAAKQAAAQEAAAKKAAAEQAKADKAAALQSSAWDGGEPSVSNVLCLRV